MPHKKRSPCVVEFISSTFVWDGLAQTVYVFSLTNILQNTGTWHTLWDKPYVVVEKSPSYYCTGGRHMRTHSHTHNSRVMGPSIIKIKRSWDRLIFIVGIHVYHLNAWTACHENTWVKISDLRKPFNVTVWIAPFEYKGCGRISKSSNLFFVKHKKDFKLQDLVQYFLTKKGVQTGGSLLQIR